jgi:hypothetical protein
MTDRTGSFRLLEALDLLKFATKIRGKDCLKALFNDSSYKYSGGISKKHNWGQKVRDQAARRS